VVTDRRIPVAEPALTGNERKYVLDALDSTWISSKGRYIDDFERTFAELCGARHAVAVCNGTAALHVALLAAGVRPGDEVLVPALSYIATANAVTYCGARPVFAESEPTTGNIDPTKLEGLVTPRTKGIVIVHLYGHPVDMDPIHVLAAERGLTVVEDAAEAHGAEYRGKKVGTLSDVAAFSFFGNKILTTGEGGMVLTDDSELADRARLLRGQGQDPKRRYWFPVIGFNYRMTNVAAAIGLAQVEQFEWHLGRRREVATWYEERLGQSPNVRLIGEQPGALSAFWMNNIVIRGDRAIDRDSVIEALAGRGIETRPFFYPLHTMPPYLSLAPSDGLPVAEHLGRNGISLPSSATLTRDDVDYICDAVEEITAASCGRA
jgi:perosamine synthetase